MWGYSSTNKIILPVERVPLDGGALVPDDMTAEPLAVTELSSVLVGSPAVVVVNKEDIG